MSGGKNKGNGYDNVFNSSNNLASTQELSLMHLSQFLEAPSVRQVSLTNNRYNAATQQVASVQAANGLSPFISSYALELPTLQHNTENIPPVQSVSNLQLLPYQESPSSDNLHDSINALYNTEVPGQHQTELPVRDVDQASVWRLSSYDPEKAYIKGLTPVAIAYKLEFDTLARDFENTVKQDKKQRKRRQTFILAGILILIFSVLGFLLGFFLVKKHLRDETANALDWPDFNKNHAFMFPSNISLPLSMSLADNSATLTKTTTSQFSDSRVILSPEIKFQVTSSALTSKTTSSQSDAISAMAEHYRKYLFPHKDCQIHDTRDLPYPLISRIILNITDSIDTSSNSFLTTSIDDYTLVISTTATPPSITSDSTKSNQYEVNLIISVLSHHGMARAFESLSSLVVSTTVSTAPSQSQKSDFGTLISSPGATPSSTDSCLYVVPVAPMTIQERPHTCLRGIYIDMKLKGTATSQWWSSKDIEQAIKYASWVKLNTAVINLPIYTGSETFEALIPLSSLTDNDVINNIDSVHSLPVQLPTPTTGEPINSIPLESITELTKGSRMHGVHLIPRIDLTHPGVVALAEPAPSNNWIICSEWCREYNSSTDANEKNRQCAVLDISNIQVQQAQTRWFNDLVSHFDGPIHVGNIFHPEYINCLLTQGTGFGKSSSVDSDETQVQTFLKEYYTKLLVPLNRLIIYSEPTATDGTPISLPYNLDIKSTNDLLAVQSLTSTNGINIAIPKPNSIRMLSPTYLRSIDPNILWSTAGTATVIPSDSDKLAGVLVPLDCIPRIKPDSTNQLSEKDSQFNWMTSLAYFAMHVWNPLTIDSNTAAIQVYLVQRASKAVAEFMNDVVRFRISKGMLSY